MIPKMGCPRAKGARGGDGMAGGGPWRRGESTRRPAVGTKGATALGRFRALTYFEATMAEPRSPRRRAAIFSSAVILNT